MTTRTPTNWRAREAAKEQERREVARRTTEEADRKRYEKTETNFPNLVAKSNRVVIPPQGFSKLAQKWQEDDSIEKQMEAYKRASSERERQIIIHRFRHSIEEPVYEDEYDGEYEEEEEPQPRIPMTVQFPGHGKRHTFTLPDNEGWRTVVRRALKKKRELTNMELYRKYMNTHGDDDSQSEGMNEDLTERDQRREFY